MNRPERNTGTGWVRHALGWLAPAGGQRDLSGLPCRRAGVPGYPVHLVQHDQLPDGQPLVIRPIKPQDMEAERAFLQGLSEQTRYRRLLSPRKLLSGELRRLTHIDYRQEMALAAFVGPTGRREMIGVSRYAPDPESGVHDFAIVIADRHQGLGLGRKLLEALLEAACQAGLQRLEGITLADNQGMLRLARSLGFATAAEAGDASVVRLQLQLAHAQQGARPAWTPSLQTQLRVRS